MVIEFYKDQGTVVAAVKGRMDAVTSEDFEKGMGEWIAKGERAFIVDLQEMDYISSAGLRAILKVSKSLKPQNGVMRFRGLQDQVKEVFKISGFDTLFQTGESRKTL
jgi:anti-anti-sigma factor